MPGMRKAADIVVASLLRHLTGGKGPYRLDAEVVPQSHDRNPPNADDASIPLDGCGLMPEQQQSKVRACCSQLGVQEYGIQS